MDRLFHGSAQNWTQVRTRSETMRLARSRGSSTVGIQARRVWCAWLEKSPVSPDRGTEDSASLSKGDGVFAIVDHQIQT